MELRMDFVNFFQTDITLSILSRLDDSADIVRAAAVSKSWHRFVINNCLSKTLCLRKAPMVANITTIMEQEGYELTIDFRSYPLSFNTLKKDHRLYSCLLQALSLSLSSYPKICIECVVGASSTNNYPLESVVNVLLSIDTCPWGSSYWSSKGQENPNVPETILFKLKGGVCIVTEINIRPFQSFLEFGNPIYSAKFVRFRMGRPKSNDDLKVDFESLPLQQFDDDNYVWEYTSPEYPMEQDSSLQCFLLPEPVLCIGGYLQVELLGRCWRKEDALYYFCISHVKVLGHSLKPAFDIEMGATSESIFFKYSPHAVEKVLKRIELDGDDESDDGDDDDAGDDDEEYDDDNIFGFHIKYPLWVHQIQSLRDLLQ